LFPPAPQQVIESPADEIGNISYKTNIDEGLVKKEEREEKRGILAVALVYCMYICV